MSNSCYRLGISINIIDISFFIDVSEYRRLLDETIDEIKMLPTAEGHDEILMPGEPEHRTHTDRLEHGIPLPPGTVEKLQKAGQQLNLDSPV